MAASKIKVLAERKNHVLKKRGEQLRINLLAFHGGRDYVCERLSRFMGEIDLQWFGSSAQSGGDNNFSVTSTSIPAGIPGRRDRASLNNMCRRATDKINQYVFSQKPKRDGISEDFAEDCTKSGLSIDQYWEQVSSLLTVNGWCWLSVDAPAFPTDENGVPIAMSEAQRQSAGITPYWSVWNANQVVDWSFDNNGAVEWLVTENTVYVSESPFVPEKEHKVRDLWQPGQRTRIIFEKKGEKPIAPMFFPAPEVVPFLPVGVITQNAHPFDDMEASMRSTMDLESAYDEILHKNVYPQMVIPPMQARDGIDAPSDRQVTDHVFGSGFPIQEDEITKGITRYVTPSSADLSILQGRVSARKQDFFESFGLYLRMDTGNAESAQAKKWGHLDTEAVLTDRANKLEEAENKLVELTKMVDPNFAEYEADYHREFDVSDIEEDMKAFVIANQMDMPDEARTELNRGIYRKLIKSGVLQLSDEDTKRVLDAFDSTENQFAFTEPEENDG